MSLLPEDEVNVRLFCCRVDMDFFALCGRTLCTLDAQKKDRQQKKIDTTHSVVAVAVCDVLEAGFEPAKLAQGVLNPSPLTNSDTPADTQLKFKLKLELK